MPFRRFGPILPITLQLALLAFVLVLLGQIPLALNPGYYSHDELQWAAFAADGRTFPWTAIEKFQYRPLTFNVWLWLSSGLFETPRVFHAVLVAAGAMNASLACLLAVRLGARPGPALAGAVLFGLGPHAMFVHGWIGTIGDVLWLCFALLAALAATARRLPLVVVALLVATTTLLALLAKEAAVAIPPLLALATWLATTPGSVARRRMAVATGVSGLVVAAYLALRLGVLLGAPGSSSYATSPANAPMRWLEQQLYPFDPGVGEIHTFFARGITTRVLVCGALWLAIVAALARAGWRWPVAFLLGGIAALAPALPLASAANQYGYGFACVATLLLASAWSVLRTGGRVLLSLAALLVLWHGVNVMRHVKHVGERQARFSPAVATALGAQEGVLRLRAEDPNDHWMYLRLTHEIPHYRGIAFGDRVRMVGEGEPADRIIRDDGSLAPVR